MAFLKVGELAKASGVTVRALHHYDAIGLLAPSVRSEGGYRLYDPADAARLRAIVAMQALGLPLDEIRGLLESDGGAMHEVVVQRMAQIEREIRERSALRDRLQLVRELIASGGTPSLGAWVDALSGAESGARHLAPEELRRILANLRRSEDDWRALIADVRAEMALGSAPTAPHVQGLARRWMDASLRGMDGDMARLQRWVRMRRDGDGPPDGRGIDAGLSAFIGAAIELRLALLHRHVEPADLTKLDSSTGPEFAALDAQARQAIAEGVAPASAQGRAFALRWSALMDRLVRGDAALREKLLGAFRAEPLLRIGGLIGDDVTAFLRAAAEHAATPGGDGA